MAYVFGIQVPLNEMVFIIAVALLGCMIAVLIEMKKMGAMMMKERQDLTRFEGDLQIFEKDEKNLESIHTAQGQQHAAQYKNAVRESLTKGMTEQQILAALQSKGVSEEHAQKLMKEVKEELKPA